MERHRKRARKSADNFPGSGPAHGVTSSSQQRLGLLDLHVDLFPNITWFLQPPDILALRETCKLLCNAIDRSRTHIVLHLAHVQQTIFLNRCKRVESCSASINPSAAEHLPSQSAAVDASGPGRVFLSHRPPFPTPPSQRLQLEPYRSCILSAFDKWPRLEKVYVLGDSPESYITRLVQDAFAAGRLPDLRRILLRQTVWRNRLNATAVEALVICESALLDAISDREAVEQLEKLDLPRLPLPLQPDGAGAAAAAAGAAAVPPAGEAGQDDDGELLPPPPDNIPDQRIREPVAQSLIHWLVHFAAVMSYSGSYDEAGRVARLLWAPPLADAARATLAAAQLARERPLDAARTVLEMQPWHARALAAIVQETIQQKQLQEQQKQNGKERKQQLPLQGERQQRVPPVAGDTCHGSPDIQPGPQHDSSVNETNEHGVAGDASGDASTAAVAAAMASAPAEVRELHSRLAALAAMDGGAGMLGALGHQIGAGFGLDAVLLGPPSPLVLAFAEAVAACANGRPESGLGLLHLHWLRFQVHAERQRNELLQKTVRLERELAELRSKKKRQGPAIFSDGNGRGDGSEMARDEDAGRNDTDAERGDGAATRGAAAGGAGEAAGGAAAGGAAAGGAEETDGDSGISGDRGGDMDWRLLTLQEIQDVQRELYMLARRLATEQEDFAAAVNEYVNKHVLPAGRVHRYSACWPAGINDVAVAEAAAAAMPPSTSTDVTASMPATAGPAAADVAAAVAAAVAPRSPPVLTGSGQQVCAPAVTVLDSQADVLSFLIRMVHKHAPQPAPGCARSPRPENNTAGPSATPSMPPSLPVAPLNGGTHRLMSPPPSSSSSTWTFDNSIREALSSVAALLLIGSGYIGAATRLLAAAPLTSHLQRASLLDRMWALIGANSTWIRYLPCHRDVQDAAGKHVHDNGPELHLETTLGSRVNFLESQRFWFLGDDEEDLGEMEEDDDGDEEMAEEDDEDAEGAEGGDDAEAADEQAAGGGDGWLDDEDQDNGDVVGVVHAELAALANGAVAFAAAMGIPEEAAQEAFAAIANAALGPNGGGGDGGGLDIGGGQAMEAGLEIPNVPALVGEAVAADMLLQHEQQALEGWNMDQLLQGPQMPPPQAPPEHGANGLVAPPAFQPAPEQQQQPEVAAAVAAGVAAPAAVPLPHDFPGANPVSEEQEEQFVRKLSRGVQYLWSASTYSCASDVSPLQFPSGDLCIRGPHPCRGFRSQPDLVRHAEAIMEAVLQGCSKDSVVEGARLPSLALRAGGAAAPPGSNEVWQTSLAALMAACASVAGVQRRAMAMVMAMPDVRARLAAAVAVAAELVQQGKTSLAGELLLTAYGTSPHRCGDGRAAAADAMDVDSNGGDGDISSFVASSAEPIAAAANPLSTLDFNMTLSGYPALAWACAHLDRVVRLATGRARVCAVASVLNSQVASFIPTTSVAAYARAHTGPALLNACAAFPAEEARALVPLMRSLPAAFLERCLTEVPVMLQPTDVARQLLLTSLGRPDPPMGREDMALALQQVMYYSRLSVGSRVGLRSAADMSPLERELTGVSLLLTSLIRFIETPTPRALAVTGAGLGIGVGLGALQGEEEADGAAADVLAGWLGQQQLQQPQHPEQEMELEDAEEAVAEGLNQQVGGEAVAAGLDMHVAHLAAAAAAVLGPE
ncbi:hypothetical protein Vretifemale_1148, partial [Volvox reticuliferus]